MSLAISQHSFAFYSAALSLPAEAPPPSAPADLDPGAYFGLVRTVQAAWFLGGVWGALLGGEGGMVAGFVGMVDGVCDCREPFQPVRQQMVPIVGNESQWPGAAQVVKGRVTGAGAERIRAGGGNPWSKDGLDERIAVWWAMQSNPWVKYDADQRSFYVEGRDGSRRYVADVDQVIAVMNQNGGARPDNGAGFRAVASFVANATGPLAWV